MASSVQRNMARLDLQLYVEIPDKKLAEIEQPGWRRNAIDMVNTLVVGAETPGQVVTALRKYVVEWRIKVSGGNIQLARDTHLQVKP